MSSYDQHKEDITIVEELVNLPVKDQAEKIAESFAKISNEYQPLNSEEIDLNLAENNSPTPLLEQHEVYEYLKHIKTNTATVKDDVPAKLIKECAFELSFPLTNLINSCILDGIYPNIYKIEIVTPVPKVYPTNTVNELRKISGLKNFSKIMEKIISVWMISDMSIKRDMAMRKVCL